MARRNAKKDAAADILERGDIYFIYRPKVTSPGADDGAADIEDVERFYMVLKPARCRLYRLMVIGRKRLPDIDRRERNWGFVEAVAKSGATLEKGLREQHYQTKTRGERVRAAARPAGEGVYALLRAGRSMRLAYALELPRRPGKVQRQLNIAPEANFVLSVKNPEKGSPPNTGLPEDEEADYPKSVQREFRGRRFAAEDPHLLDFEGAEFVLVGAREEGGEEFGVELGAERESERSADILRELQMARSRHPVRPLLQGEWR